jgi:hypothetical protein
MNPLFDGHPTHLREVIVELGWVVDGDDTVIT